MKDRIERTSETDKSSRPVKVQAKEPKVDCEAKCLGGTTPGITSKDMQAARLAHVVWLDM